MTKEIIAICSIVIFMIERSLSQNSINNPVRVPAKIDSAVSLPCPFSTVNRTHLTWKHNTSILDYSTTVTYRGGFSNNTHLFVESNNSLLIVSVAVSDQLVHSCTVSYNNAGPLQYFSLPLVYTPPTSATLSHHILVIDENTTTDLTCFVASVYPSNTLQIHIKLGDTRVCSAPVNYNNNSDGTIRAQGLCTLRFNRTANGQTAKCEVDFQYNEVEPATVTSGDIPVSVQYCDTINLTSNSTPNVNENTPVTFTCRTQCNPSPTMNLIIGNSTLNSAVAESIQYTLLIQREDHEKNFKCKISGQSGLDSSAVFFYINFNARQVFLTTSISGYIAAGSSVILTCITDEAYPTATVSWSWSGSGAVPGTVTNTEEAGTCCGSAKRKKSERVIVAVNKTYNSKIIFCNSSSLANSTTLNVKFPPTTATIANLTSVAVVERIPLRFTCTTDVLNPRESLTNFVWTIGSSPLNNATMPEFVSASIGYGGYTGSSTVTFTAMRIHDQEAVSCKPVWNGTNISGSPQPVTVTVYYLPQIMVSVNDSGFVDENSVCVLTCSISGGNPSNVALYSFTWIWRANPEVSEVNLQQNRQTLTYNTVTYKQSGLYKCNATSIAGTTEAETRLNVRYAPIGKEVNEDRKTIYANYNSSSVLDLTVHSFPTGANVTFTWTKGGNSISSQRLILANNETMSNVNISSVSSADYGNYTVVVTNGGSRRSTFYIELKLQGKPTPAVDIGAVSVSYKQIIISFRPGMDGGETQTLEVMYKMDESSSGYRSAGVIIDPQPGIRRNFTIMGVVEPSTRYEIVIFSDNTFSGSATRSNSHFVTTKAKPSLQEKNLSITRSWDEYTLRWPEIVLEDGDSLYVRQCKGRDCLNHDVGGLTERVFHKNNGTTFSLQYYQGLDLVSNLVFTVKKGPASSAGSNGGVIAGSVVSVILIVVLASVGLLCWRKVFNQRRQKSDANVYMTTTNSTEVDNAAQVYDERKLNQENNEEYTSLTPLRSATVYENFIFSKNSKADIIHSGHFLTYQCQLECGLCALKTLKGEAFYIHEVKWILAQTTAMKSLPFHRNIAEIVACNSDIETPLLVTKLAVKGDLKSTLVSYDRNTADGLFISVRNALDIVEGMNFLSKYHLLHYELSTSHVLLGQNDECKIINFASAESVRARQKNSLKLNDLSCVPWLAPECLITADEHCTASDVWSFGVLLYEIIVSGDTAYKDMSSEEIGEFVLQGKTLDIPVEGKHFGEIITRCWNFEPADRPDWTQLKEMLVVLHAQFDASEGVYETVRFEGH